MKKLLFILLGVVLSFPVFGQQNYEGITVSRGKIFTAGPDTVDGQYIVLSKDSAEYYLGDSQQRHVLSLNDVTEIQKYNGTYATTGTWIGGFGGLAIGLVIALGSKETNRTVFYEETTIQTWPIYVFTLVGTLAGYLIGNQIEDWDTVYKNNKAISQGLGIKLNNSRGVIVSYRLCF